LLEALAAPRKTANNPHSGYDPQVENRCTNTSEQ